MANLYVRSTDGSDADNGSTWALAKASIAGAGAIDAAGDAVWISQVHAESLAAGQTCSWAGVAGNPVKVMCGNDGAEPPTALATSATMTTTGANGIAWNGFTYTFGIAFFVGSGNNAVNITLCNTANNQQVFEQCDFRLPTTQGSSGILAGQGAGTKTTLVDCRFRFASAGQGIVVNGFLHIKGGSIISGGTNITTFLKGFGNSGHAVVENFDFSNLSSALVLAAYANSLSNTIFRNCKLPSGWTGTLSNGTPTPSARTSMYNCDSGNTNYRLKIWDYAGSIDSETTLVLSGGATDGSTHTSWKMVSSANVSYRTNQLMSDPIAVWLVPAGSPTSPQTATVEILHDSATNLTDEEVWLEVSYFGDSGSAVGAFADDSKANFVATAADQDASSATWTTTGMANPNKQKLVVTFTPEQAGFLYCRVALAKASKTIYVDPVVSVA